MLLQPTVRSLLGDNPILQEVQADGSLSVLVDNLECEDVDLEPGTLVGSVQKVTATPAVLHSDNSPPPEGCHTCRVQRSSTEREDQVVGDAVSS